MFNNRNRRNAYAMVMVICLVAFEFFSYASSYQAIYDLMGIGSWATTLGLAFVLVDFGGIGKLFTGAPSDESDRILAWAWVLSAFGDSFLTFMAVQLAVARRASVLLVNQGVITATFMQVYVPIFVAVLVWAVQFFLVKSLNSIIDDIVRRG